MIDAALGHEEAGRYAEALAQAWSAFDAAPGDRETRLLLVRLLSQYPRSIAPDRREDLARLLADDAVEPSSVSRAGWSLLLTEDEPLAALGGDPAALAQWAERDRLLHRLLEECPVTVLAAERALTRLRNWLLLSGRWPDHPRLVEALAAQAQWNGGAWPFDAEERALLDSAPAAAIAAAYFPPAAVPAGAGGFADAVTAAVAEQYEQWPYPAWSRITTPRQTTLPEVIAGLDGGRPSGLPVEAELLVAGCGTGHEAAELALTYPDARVTAIDLSESSLRYARERCRRLGLERIEFRRLDLHHVAELGTGFDFVSCSGVLHHLPDPEAGWAALAAVLRPGGAMRVMLYSKLARLRVDGARRRLADLHGRRVDGDLLREARRKLIETSPELVERSHDFYTLAGAHDLLFHRHEDAFDVPRIARALGRLGLELLAFELPTPLHRTRYRLEHPDDPAFRDLDAWFAIEKREPFLFARMYDFWCRRPRDGRLVELST